MPGSPSDRIDRFGHNFGFFFGNGIDSYSSRSLLLIRQDSNCSTEFYDHLSLKLPPGAPYPSEPKDQPIEYNQYKIIKPFKVKTCIAANITNKGTLLGQGLARQFRLFEGSLTETQKNEAKIKPKTDLDNKTVPNVQELLDNGFIKRIDNPTNLLFQ